MMWWRFNGQPAGNGWTSPANNGAFGTDYYHRTRRRVESLGLPVAK
jgi:hypothetical protein